MQEFIKTNREKLKEIEDTFSVAPTEVWDPVQDPVAFKFLPQDNQRFDELITTQNRLLYKVILVFANLSREMNELSEIVSTIIYNYLL